MSNWESAIFSPPRDLDLGRLASELRGLTAACKPVRKVVLHFMAGLGRCSPQPMMSVEMTSFRTKPLSLISSVGAEVGNAVFGDGPLVFSRPEILIARRVSVFLAAPVVYVYFSDSYNSSGYVVFSEGDVGDYGMLGWAGSRTLLTRRELPVETTYGSLFLEGLKMTFPELAVHSVENLFECFYSDQSEVTSFVLVDQGKELAVAQRLAEGDQE